MILMTRPVCALTTETVPPNRFEIHRRLPSGDTAIMSGEPPIRQVRMTLRVEKSMTDSDPASRLLTYSQRVEFAGSELVWE